MLFCGFASYADYTGSVTTATTDLSFTTKSGYNVVSFANGQSTMQVGAPQLPSKTLSFVIPVDQMVSSINITGTSTVSVAGSYTMYPTQPGRISDSLAFVNPDTSIYNHNTAYPSVQYTPTDDGYPFGYHVVTITFYPVQYKPTSHALIVYTNINFTIVYAANTASILLPNIQSVFSNSLAKSSIQGIVVNPSDVGVVSGGARQVSGVIQTGANLRGVAPTGGSNFAAPDYVIITRSDLVGDATHGFQMLANWKTQKGVNTIIVTTDGTSGIYHNYQGYDNQEKIRNYLKDVYVNFGSAFILLGGDVTDASGAEVVPARTAYTKTEIAPNPDFFVTDYYYATVQGNWNSNGNNVFGEDGTNTHLGNDFTAGHTGDMSAAFMVGRAPSQSLTQATLFANKIIEYEKLSNTTTKSYVDNIVYLFNDLTWGGKSVMDAAASTYFTSPLSVSKYYSSNSSPNQMTVTNAMNAMNGQTHLLYHFDHSGFDFLTCPSTIPGQGISGTSMSSLTNASITGAHYYSIFVTDGCNANDFQKNAGVSKEYINNPNGGGVAFLGNTDFGRGGDYSLFTNYFVPMLYSTGTVGGLAAYDNKRYHIGYANLWEASNSVGYYDNLYSYLKNRNILGDPEMMFWTKTPSNFTLSSLTLSSGTLSGTIGGLPGSTFVVTVTIWKGSEIWQTQDITTATSTQAFSFTNVVPNTTGNVTVTITGHNYIPYIDNSTINISSITGSHPYMTGYSIVDNTSININNNNDAYADAGETISLPVTLTNSGSSNTSATINASLSWAATTYQTSMLTNASSLVNITTNTSGNFAVIASGGGTQVTPTPFVFTINKDAFTVSGTTPRPLNITVSFSLTIKDGSTVISVTPFNVVIGEPNLIQGENKIVSGTLAASTSNQLTVNLYNIGASQATGLTATLSKASDPSGNITILGTGPGNSAYPNINGVGNTTNSALNSTAFTFSVGSLAAYQTNETFNLTVTNAHSKTWVFGPFNVQPIIASPTASGSGNLTSINLNWACGSCTTLPCAGGCITSPTGDMTQGFNLYRSAHLAGVYTKINNNLINSFSFYDDGEGTPLSQLTVYDYQLTVVDVNGNESAPYSFTASTSLPLHNGWPVTPSTTIDIIGGRMEGSPNVYDLYDGTNAIQGNKEIFFGSGGTFGGGGSNGGIWGFEHTSARWYSYDGNITNKSGYINIGSGVSGTPFVADIDNDGTAELGITSHGGGSNGGDLLVYNVVDAATAAVYENVTNYPKATSPAWDIIKGPTTADLDKDGQLEIIENDLTNGGLKVYNADGTANAAWTVPAGYAGGTLANGFSMPVAFDFDNDGKKEIVIGCTNNSVTSVSGVYVYKKDGSAYGTNPIYVNSADRHDYPPVVADLNNDGSYEIIFMSVNGTTANLYAYNPSTASYLTGWNSTSHPSITLATGAGNAASGFSGGQFAPGFSVGDVDKDGYPEVSTGDNGNFYVWKHDGTQLSHYTYSYAAGGYYPAVTYNAPVLADVDGTNTDLEVVFLAAPPSPQSGTNIYAFKAATGISVVGFPIHIVEGADNTSCVANIDDGDNPNQKNEVIVTTTENFYVWDSQGDATNNIYGWGSYRKDNYNSGIYFQMADGFLYDEDIYLQNKTNLGSSATNHYRYYFGRNVSAGSSVTGKTTGGAISFDASSNIIIEATNGVLLQADVAIPVGCVFEIK
ncbi:MAG TPA: C25 family peptidase propeptide domain-containing protein [Bacteroidia bacterium]|nr:C25 family peptidase propeptide domain-containing protein [Bacteroidia bacterium]